MKHYFIHRQQHSRLICFFSGWGMDEHPFIDYCPSDSDLLIFYDYRSLQLDTSLLQGYDEIRVVGWSMGVWAASQVLQNLPLPLIDSVAINGTMTPVDDGQGIPYRIFQGTLDSLNERNLKKFQIRMCGGLSKATSFWERCPLRTLEELKEELHFIGEQATVLPVSRFVWKKAWVGSDDMIFTEVNQKRAWKQTDTTINSCPMAHYDEERLRDLLTNWEC